MSDIMYYCGKVYSMRGSRPSKVNGVIPVDYMNKAIQYRDRECSDAELDLFVDMLDKENCRSEVISILLAISSGDYQAASDDNGWSYCDDGGIFCVAKTKKMAAEMLSELEDELN